MAQLRNLLFLDTETLGLNPNRYELIEIGAVLTTPDAKEVLSEFEARVMPLNPLNFEEQAANVNGYAPDTWTPTIGRREAADEFCILAKEVILVGQNPGFDEGHLLAYLTSLGMRSTWHYHKVDNATLAWPLYVAGKVSSLSGDAVRAYFGLPPEPKPHRALTGAKCALDNYRKLMEAYGKLTA